MIGRLERTRAGLEAGPALIESRGDFIKSCRRLTFSLLAGLATMATAQDDTRRDDGIWPGEVPTCPVSGASRVSEACGVDPPTILRTEQEFTLSLELATEMILQCETRVDLEYDQRDTIVRVDGVIENETCAASSGRYEIEAQVKDENGEAETLVFSELWQRDDDQPVAVAGDYPIGENVELIRLRLRRLRCTCSDSIEE